MYRPFPIAFVLSIVFLCLSVSAQICKPPEIVANSKSENIFRPEQEMDLGDAMFERLQRDYRIIDDTEVNSYLQTIGDRLVKHLPASSIHYQYSIADLPDTNAYAMAGGRIFVTRKLISFVRNEDELAGVIAHELGHAMVRHHATDMSRYFKEILGIAQVGDRRDVFDKYNLFIENWRTKRIKFSDNHENAQQLEADKIGMYALMAAGYDPHIYIAFWGRFTEAKKINFLTELFGKKRPADKRLKEMIVAIKLMPQDCFETKARETFEHFERWRSLVINFSGLGKRESLSGLLQRTKLLPLRSDIEHLRFSPSGEFLLAQDSSSVTVMSRNPFKVVFRFDAEDSNPAAFTPDSEFVIVHNRNLRVQKWSIAEKRPVSTHEVAIPKGLWQSHVSPDGSVVAAYQRNGDLVLYNVATNEEIFKEKSFYVPDYLEYFVWNLTLDLLDLNELSVVNMKFSPDGKYFLAGRKNPQSLGIGRQETVAVDLAARKLFPIGDNIKKLLFNAFAFLGSDRIVGQSGRDIEKSGVFAFPDGQRIEQFELSGNQFEKAERSDYLVVRPVSGAAVGVYDLKTKKYVVANKKSALDVFENQYVAERRNGELAIYHFGKTESTAVLELPPSTFGNLRTASISADGTWLAVSDRSRGAVWNLKTGERSLHIRGFRGSFFANDGKVYADFPKQGETERTIAAMDVIAGTIKPANLVSTSNTRQHGQYLVTRKSKNEKPEKESKRDDRPAYTEEERDKAIGFKDTIFEVRKVQSNLLLWTRHFENETPRYFVIPLQNTVIFVWRLGSQAAKDIVKTDPALAAKMASMQEKNGDYLFQFVDMTSGVDKGKFLLETGEGSFAVERVSIAEDYVVVADGENRILIYSLKTGRLVSRFFGEQSAVSPSSGLIAVSNVPGRVTIYDLNTGTERTRLSFLKPLSMLQFMPDGKRLFVLTSDQTAFFFEPFSVPPRNQ